jgi:hypothetical protein
VSRLEVPLQVGAVTGCEMWKCAIHMYPEYDVIIVLRLTCRRQAMTSWRCSCIRPDKRDDLSTYYTEQPCRTHSTKVPFLMSRRLRASSEQSSGIESMRCRLLVPRRAQHETTAAHAQAEAPNAHVAHEVEENAEHLQQAAIKAAQAAQVSCVHPSRRKVTYTLQPVGNGV